MFLLKWASFSHGWGDRIQRTSSVTPLPLFVGLDSIVPEFVLPLVVGAFC